MDRISSNASQANYLTRLLTTQSRVNDLQTQVSTGKKSQTYTGIAKDATRLINTENEMTTAKSFADRNVSTNVELSAMNNSMNSAMGTIKKFLSRLDEYSTNNKKDANTVDSIQQEAMRAIIDLQSSLNISVDGQYLFAGGKVSSEPVKFPAGTLAQFQTQYDGMNVTYPTKGAAQMQDLTLKPVATGGLVFNADGTMQSVNASGLKDVQPGSTITISGSAGNNNTYTVVSKQDDQTVKLSRLTAEPASAAATISYTDASGAKISVGPLATGTLDFSPMGDTITSSSAGGFGGIPVGTVFTVAGSANGNDGTYQVKAMDPTNSILTIESVKVTAEGSVAAPVNATLSSTSWYKGDDLIQQRRVDSSQTIDTGVLAKDPAFEKAIRAMAIIAQGAFGTAGGLDSNPQRVDAARFLLRDAQSSPNGGTPPYGPEAKSDIMDLQAKLGWNQSVVATKNEKHNQFAAFLEKRAADIENADPTEASVRLLDEMNVLNASYATVAKVSQLSLLNYMK